MSAWSSLASICTSMAVFSCISTLACVIHLLSLSRPLPNSYNLAVAPLSVPYLVMFLHSTCNIISPFLDSFTTRNSGLVHFDMADPSPSNSLSSRYSKF
ncbi:hypothetical protein V8C26DRAFT_111893 [Trichoderma gracile]